MSFKMDCPHCKRTLNVSEKAIGKTVPCPGCSQPVTIPQEPPSLRSLRPVEATIPALQTAHAVSLPPMRSATPPMSEADSASSAFGNTLGPPPGPDSNGATSASPSLIRDGAEDAWLLGVRRRLLSADFVVSDDLSFGGTTFKMVARRSRFELTKFGFSETFFVFAEFDSLNTLALRTFSSKAFHCAKEIRKIGLPCGLFEGVFCYAVAIARLVDYATVNALQNECPPKHWAAAEIPVVYDLIGKKPYKFEKTPIWGAAYYKGFRTMIEQFLS
jgi:hypothetical protein